MNDEERSKPYLERVAIALESIADDVTIRRDRTRRTVRRLTSPRNGNATFTHSSIAVACPATTEHITVGHLAVEHTMLDGTRYYTGVDIRVGSDGLPDGSATPYQGYACVEDCDEYRDIVGQPLFDRDCEELAHHLYRLCISHWAGSQECDE